MISLFENFSKLSRLPNAKEWEELENEIPPSLVSKMRAHYSHPDDVDLFTGLLSENKVAQFE